MTQAGRPTVSVVVPFAGDELVLPVDLANHQGLQDAVGANAGAESSQLLVVEGLARLHGVGLDELERDLRLFDLDSYRWGVGAVFE